MTLAIDNPQQQQQRRPSKAQRVAQEKAARSQRRAEANAAARDRAAWPVPNVRIGSSAMTPREQHLMAQIVKPLHDEGVIDRRYMGIRFLELFVLGWTPMRYVMIGQTLRLVGLWMSDSEFEAVWNWWTYMPYETRNIMCSGAARRFLSVDNGYRRRK